MYKSIRKVSYMIGSHICSGSNALISWGQYALVGPIQELLRVVFYA